MEKYRRVPRDRLPIKDDEIRITSGGRLPNYVTYAAKLFNEQEKPSLTIKATGNAIARAITLAEVIKRRFRGLHQLTECGSTTIVDVYEPREEGLDTVKHERVVSFITISLSRDATAYDENDPGYQAPLDDALVKELSPEEVSRSRQRAPRGGRGGRRGPVPYGPYGDHPVGFMQPMPVQYGPPYGAPPALYRGRRGMRDAPSGPRGEGGVGYRSRGGGPQQYFVPQMGHYGMGMGPPGYSTPAYGYGGSPSRGRGGPGGMGFGGPRGYRGGGGGRQFRDRGRGGPRGGGGRGQARGSAGDVTAAPVGEVTA